MDKLKTELIQIRDLNGSLIRQSTKNGFFNANDLLALYNIKNPNKEKKLADYFMNKSTNEMRIAITQDEEKDNVANSRYLKSLTQEEGKDDRVVISKRGKNGGTWVHPYLLVDLGMWLSIDFRLMVIKWVYDGLIKVRNEAGGSFKEVNNALLKNFPNKSFFQFPTEANMINTLVFGTPEPEQRNKATEEQLRLLDYLQKADIKMINEGRDYYDRKIKLTELKGYMSL